MTLTLDGPIFPEPESGVLRAAGILLEQTIYGAPHGFGAGDFLLLTQTSEGAELLIRKINDGAHK